MKEYETFIEIELYDDAPEKDIKNITECLCDLFAAPDFNRYDSMSHGTSYGWTIGIVDEYILKAFTLSKKFPEYTFSLRQFDGDRLCINKVVNGKTR